jgi:hypothetical protein
MQLIHKDTEAQVTLFGVTKEKALSVLKDQIMMINHETKIADINISLDIKDVEIIYSREETNINARDYLDSTDWYVTRQAETGKAIPEDILTKRQEARDSIVENN